MNPLPFPLVVVLAFAGMAVQDVCQAAEICWLASKRDSLAGWADFVGDYARPFAIGLTGAEVAIKGLNFSTLVLLTATALGGKIGTQVGAWLANRLVRRA